MKFTTTFFIILLVFLSFAHATDVERSDENTSVNCYALGASVDVAVLIGIAVELDFAICKTRDRDSGIVLEMHFVPMASFGNGFGMGGAINLNYSEIHMDRSVIDELIMYAETDNFCVHIACETVIGILLSSKNKQFVSKYKRDDSHELRGYRSHDYEDKVENEKVGLGIGLGIHSERDSVIFRLPIKFYDIDWFGDSESISDDDTEVYIDGPEQQY
ncbi:MAG: hypothetical protein ISR65_15225 [Bacteriovoracaceae bacterium]|nr:hypothetical protein [Bacteriovoracaceae bacterium]